MPHYAMTKKTYSKSQGKWVNKQVEQAFDYESVNDETATFLLSFFRWFPDYLLDILHSDTANYKLEFPQRMMLRAMARYKDVYITSCRGLTKTYTVLLYAMIKGILYPREIIRYQAPAQKQAAEIASKAFHQIEKDYPILASYWNLRHDNDMLFIIQSVYGSEFGMYNTRGGNSSMVIAEEIGQEGSEKDKFDMNKFENDTLPTCRIPRLVNGVPDRTYIEQQHIFISNACSRVNPAYYRHRYETMKAMVYGEKYEGYVLDFSWEVALLCNIRNTTYIKDMRKKLTANDWLREMCAIYIGTNDSPLVSDETLAKSRRLMAMEDQHCGDEEAIYIIAYDVASENRAGNAKCAKIIGKLTRFKSIEKRDKYRKQIIYVDGYPPQRTDYEQAMDLRKTWQKYSLDGAKATIIAIDARNYGKAVLEELMKPANDGLPNLCCYNHIEYTELEQPHALPVIYPIKATRQGRDDEGEMIRYAQVEFEQGNIELLTASTLDGVEQYKRRYGIKDDYADSSIIRPYKKTDELCEQIRNLTTTVSGTSFREERKSMSIQRDAWSALKYLLRVAQILEQQLVRENYRAKSSWANVADQFRTGQTYTPIAQRQAPNTVQRLLQARRVRK